jgi:hypothetical protein
MPNLNNLYLSLVRMVTMNQPQAITNLHRNGVLPTMNTIEAKETSTFHDNPLSLKGWVSVLHMQVTRTHLPTATNYPLITLAVNVGHNLMVLPRPHKQVMKPVENLGSTNKERGSRTARTIDTTRYDVTFHPSPLR